MRLNTKNDLQAYEAGCQPSINYLVFRECPRGWRLYPHFVSESDLTYIIRGKARYIINDKPYEVGAGDVICVHTDDTKEALTYKENLMACFSVNWSMFDNKGKALYPPLPPVTHIGLRENIVRNFKELVFAYSITHKAQQIKVKGLLLLVLHEIFASAASKTNSGSCDARVQRVISYIASHFNKKITVKDMARLAGGLNSAYFGSVFLRETGMTLHRYLTDFRVRRALNMLQSGSYSVCETAEECGFSDSYHFFKAFKQITGVAPSTYIPKSRGYGAG